MKCFPSSKASMALGLVIIIEISPWGVYFDQSVLPLSLL